PLGYAGDRLTGPRSRFGGGRRHGVEDLRRRRHDQAAAVWLPGPGHDQRLFFSGGFQARGGGSVAAGARRPGLSSDLAAEQSLLARRRGLAHGGGEDGARPRRRGRLGEQLRRQRPGRRDELRAPVEPGRAARRYVLAPATGGGSVKMERPAPIRWA